MTTDKATFINKITPYFDWTERIFVAGICAGLVVKYLSDHNSILLLQTSILGLGLTYFLSAYKVIEIPFKDDELLGFNDLLALTITPKIVWIGCAISLSGIFLMYQELGNNGYKKLLMMGIISIVICLIIHAYASISGTRYVTHVRHVFYRAFPLLLLNIYILFGK